MQHLLLYQNINTFSSIVIKLYSGPVEMISVIDLTVKRFNT